jgi:uncharacterized YccA/Bax inhibitor family protein
MANDAPGNFATPTAAKLLRKWRTTRPVPITETTTRSAKTLLVAGALAVALAQSASAQQLPEARMTVIGNFGLTTQSRTLEAPFGTQLLNAIEN